MSAAATDLPVLYKKDKSNRLRSWEILVEGDTTTRTSGLVSGKKVSHTRTYAGKNIGKVSETSPEEQAIREAEKDWSKQLDKGYAPDPGDTDGLEVYRRVMDTKRESGGHSINATASIRQRAKKKKAVVQNHIVNINGEGYLGPKTMKAQTWELKDSADPFSAKNKVLKHFTFHSSCEDSEGEDGSSDGDGVPHPDNPYSQVKIDGYRMIATFPETTEDGLTFRVPALTSNSGKQFPWFKHIREEYQLMITHYPDLMVEIAGVGGFDGECFTESLVDEEQTEVSSFNKIQEICGMRRSKPHPLEQQIQHHIFDIADLEADYQAKLDQHQRFSLLDQFFDAYEELYNTNPDLRDVPPEHRVFVKVRTDQLLDQQDVVTRLNEYTNLGYEGIIIRSPELRWVANARSLQMRKFKYFIDLEHPIVGVKLNHGVDPEYFVWVFEGENDDGEIERFYGKPMGSRQSRRDTYSQFKSNPKNWIGRLCTIKFQEYTPKGIPRFPVVKGVRDPEDINNCGDSLV